MKKTLLFTYVLMLCNLTLFAQITKHPRILHTKEKSAIHVPPQEVPAGLTKIYSNLGSSKTDLYNDTGGWVFYGPGYGGGYGYFLGIPFTPKSNSHISQVRVAVEYEHGANQVNLSIYGDADGLPGTLLAGPVTVTNLPEPGTCCTLAVANFALVAITGGTRYWVVADTPAAGTGSDFYGLWAFVPKIVPIASTTGFGWSVYSGDDQPAGEVLGTIP